MPTSCRPPVPEGTKTVTEGKATILHQGNNVFYNPAQVITTLDGAPARSSPPLSIETPMRIDVATAGHQQGSLCGCAALFREAEAAGDCRRYSESAPAEEDAG